MTTQVTEKQFEDTIENFLLESGYEKSTENYDRKLGIDYEILIRFIENSQQDNFNKLKEIHGENTRDEILRSVEKTLDSESMIHVLRNGFVLSDIRLDCAYFKPVSGRNPELQRLYEKNILSVKRQFHYSTKNEKSIDLGFFLNGLPVATAELKDYKNGYLDAITQYQQDRDPQEILFAFKKRAMVHFAVDPFEIHMTTKLEGTKTEFLPFNKGYNGGKGNPPNPSGMRTSYLWEKILQKDQWLDIIGRYIAIQIIPQKYPEKPKEKLIFPRYHQLDAVNLLENETKDNGAGDNYLIQHSTGSGKSNTIAWLAYKLFSLHDNDDEAIFNSVIVLSDRVGVVNQLAKTIEQFKKTEGVVEKMENTPALIDNLQTANKILITTQQKFPQTLKKIGEIKGKKFAVIIDEAHSSQAGDEAKSVVDVLSAKMPEEIKKEAQQEESKKGLVEKIEEFRSIENLSYYAFTATPKEKTLRLFGKEISEPSRRGDGIPYDPHHEYTMRQAIEEGFILDVLQNYTTYNQYFNLVKTSTGEKIVEGKRATAAILRWVNSHEMAEEAKSEVILADFQQNVKPAIGGLAKAMIVTPARLAAFKYKRILDRLIKEKEIKGVKTLVAFSGSIKDEEGNFHTEYSLNHTSTDEQLRELFDTPEYNILIVAEKYQTGYDQPLLHTMYVDKQLKGIKAVQTLSRLNRYHPLKEETRVIDFVNEAQSIQDSFKVFYEGTSLIDKVKPNFIIELFSHIMEFKIITQKDLDDFADIWFDPETHSTDHPEIFRRIEPLLDRYNKSDEKIQDEFRSNLHKYHSEYAFLTRLVKYKDVNLEKLYALIKFLVAKKLLSGDTLQLGAVQGDISLQRFRLEKIHEGNISPDSGKRNLVSSGKIPSGKKPEILTSLSDIIRAMNDQFGKGFDLSDAEVMTIDQWMSELMKNSSLKEIAKSKFNDKNDLARAFKEEFDKIIGSRQTAEKYKGLVSRIWEDEEYHSAIVQKAVDAYYERIQENHIPPITPANPVENRLRFRQTISSCRGHLHWVDRYFNYEGLEFLMHGLDMDNVKHVKILTSVYQNGINDRLYNEFSKFQNELKEKGISCEMQVIMTKDLHRQMHDRFMIAENVTYNVPSPTTVNLGQYSEIRKTTSQVPFDEWWNSSESIDILQNWDKIKEKREQLSRRY
ncbi:type I restriction endonuclease subunit R [Nitrosopumilus sp. K4]|uniref:type I restriction endonuclease subunit R n=1 Tax=Nitrosopumilus sp. K4 TaxID=2795383 RepID=UPI001BA56A15|nr:DEAD/DEAH box helicase family protein [Nitrosopumilus sp. K4]QUC64378.1 type I restriction endonuclease subunit R [Nitrosopumilus sp. K4]